MKPTVPRYLVPFHPKHILHHFVDVLVIGGGIAGMRATMAIDPQLSALVVTKDRLKESNSSYAQGGIAGVLAPDDRIESHVADTLAAGGDLCDQGIVEMVIGEAPAHIRELIEWGTVFDREDGEILLGREGGHSHNRIAHALGDATGQEIMRAMIQRARHELGAQIWQNTFTIDLLTDEGECRGALVWNKTPRQDFCLGQANHSVHWRRGTTLSRDDQSVGGDRRRPRHCLSRGCRTARHGVHAIPSHSALHRWQQS